MITDELIGKCKLFANQTGRVIRVSEPCGEPALDGSGVPTSSGTIHRLDKISKSFSGR
jgi:hypothetical protein